jgi:2-iminobutanoate/2-iminopropanoate deaminase
MARKYFAANDAVTVGPYSQAVEGGSGMVFLSGQTPLDPETRALVPGDIGMQTEQCFRNLFSVLAAAGLGESDVVKVTVFLTDMADFDMMNAVYAKKFSTPYPARSTIAVKGLPRGASIEIEMIASR